MDTAWPWTIHDCFESVPPNAKEGDYYAPYNKLLNHVFVPDSPFTVGPQQCSNPNPDSKESTDFVVNFRAHQGHVPVFVVEVKVGAKLPFQSGRQEADVQIRKRLADSVHACPLPKLRGVSTIGTRMCFYTIVAGRSIDPPRIEGSEDFCIDTAPIERWDCNVLEEEGANQFKAVICDIKEDCARLGGPTGPGAAESSTRSSTNS